MAVAVAVGWKGKGYGRGGREGGLAWHIALAVFVFAPALDSDRDLDAPFDVVAVRFHLVA